MTKRRHLHCSGKQISKDSQHLDAEHVPQNLLQHAEESLWGGVQGQTNQSKPTEAQHKAQSIANSSSQSFALCTPQATYTLLCVATIPGLALGVMTCADGYPYEAQAAKRKIPQPALFNGCSACFEVAKGFQKIKKHLLEGL